MVPDGWKVRPVGELCEFVNGRGFKAKEWSTSGLPIIRIQNLNGSRDFNLYAGEPEEKWTVHPGQLLFAWAGTKGVSFGPTIWDGPKGVLNQHIYKLELSPNIDKRWFYAVLVRVTQKIEGQAHGFKATLVHVKKADITNQPVPFPPPDEQKAIADILSTWDQAIEITEKLIENSKAQKKALMQQLLTGKKRLPGFNDEWQEYCLCELGTTYGGLSGKSKTDFGKGRPYIPYLNVFRNSAVDPCTTDLVAVSTNENQNAIQYGDILFTTSSETPQEVGMSSVVLHHPPVTFLNSFCFGFRPHTPETLAPEFARFLFRGTEFRRNISRLAQGSTRFNLSKRYLLKVEVSLPPIGEQLGIARVLSLAEQEVRAQYLQLVDLRIEKRALMQQLLTGKRRVKVAA